MIVYRNARFPGVIVFYDKVFNSMPTDQLAHAVNAILPRQDAIFVVNPNGIQAVRVLGQCFV